MLGVPKTASKTDIKKSFRRLAHKWHPDKNPNNQIQSKRMFCRISEAYSTLTDDDKRMVYDWERCRGTRRRTGGGGDGDRRREYADWDSGRNSMTFKDGHATITINYKNGVKYITRIVPGDTVYRYKDGRLMAKTVNGVPQPIPKQ